MINFDSVVKTNPELLATEIEGQLVMMHIDTGAYYNLDSIGSVIWKKIENPTQVAALCQELKKEYRDPDNLIEQDVLALLTQFAERKMILICA